MKVALIGATGYVGSRIMVEALQRGHEVSAIVRHPHKLPAVTNLTPLCGDVCDSSALAALLAGHDAVIDASYPGWHLADPAALQLQGAQGLLGAARLAVMPRLLLVGAAGTLATASGADLLDTPAFPAEMRAGALGARAVLALLNGEEQLAWTVLTPPALLDPGQRSGSFRVGDDQILVDEQGESAISLQDFAVAMIDELENPQHVRQRFTVGY
jgi:putative NADH-flavin reductase